MWKFNTAINLVAASLVVLLLTVSSAWAATKYQEVTVAVNSASASACNTAPPADVTTAGYTTTVLCQDFTQAIPNNLGTGLIGGNCTGSAASTCPSPNWFLCTSGTDYATDTLPALWAGGVQTTLNFPNNYEECNTVVQTTDPEYGNLALDLVWTPAEDALFNSSERSSGETALNTGGLNCQTCVPETSYFEMIFRSTTHYNGAVAGFPTAFDHCCGFFTFPGGPYNVGFQIDFVETFPFGWGSDGGQGGIDSIGGASGSLVTYNKFGYLFTANSSTLMACAFENDTLMNPGCYAYTMQAGMQFPNEGLVIWGGGGNNECGETTSGTSTGCSVGNNAAISSITNCGGVICITAPATSNLSNTNSDPALGKIYPVQIYGTGTVADGYYPNGLISNSGTWGPTWQISGSTWPAGGISYSGSGGILNPYTTKDTYIKSIKVMSCSVWNVGQGQTSGTGCALGTIITSEVDPHNPKKYRMIAEKTGSDGKLIRTALGDWHDFAPGMGLRPNMGHMLASAGTAPGHSARPRFDLGAGVVADHSPASVAGNGAQRVADYSGVVSSWISFLGDAMQQD